MSIPNATQTAENLLTDYAEVLNTANTAAIASFYTFDGLFMPDGYQSIKAIDLARTGERYLKKHGFHISFHIQNVSEENGFVFVQANATTKFNAHQGPEAIQTSSRDFFILRKDDTVWKIYKYIFNQDDQSVVA